MRITELETQYTDIMWFAVDKLGNIIECTSGIYGNVPEFVCMSKENTDFLENYFINILEKSTDAIILKDESFGTALLDDCKELSQKGLYCFDAYNGREHREYYTKISEPVVSLKLEKLPNDIQNLLKNNILDEVVSEINVLNVKNAY